MEAEDNTTPTIVVQVEGYPKERAITTDDVMSVGSRFASNVLDIIIFPGVAVRANVSKDQ